ncbi:MAG TPA: N,N-dimethylformamidase beta subunit family domain-containing protein [Dermatophilaceae bacterium]|nr:N,N-dimethylformamidase beta subunit family domain-containing protein [Dermatophilaceae bacterium]
MPGGRGEAVLSVFRRAAAIGVAAGLLVGCSGSPGSSTQEHRVLPPSGAAATATAMGLHAGVAGLDVASENAKEGTGSWRLERLARPGEIEGFATRTDVVPGDPLRLAVSTTAPWYGIRVYRAGWYRGQLMREVWRSRALQGHRLAPATLSAATYTVLTSWRPNEVIDTKGWPPGAYLLRLDASTGGQRYVPVTVRSTNARNALVLLDAVTTWQAYNAWGGYSLYHGPAGGDDFSHRSRAVTFDRPYDGVGASDFLGNELPAISFAEHAGLPLAYATDVALDLDPHLLDGARGVVSLGHDEYWSTKMRGQVTAARDRGVNVAFLGANAVFRHIRLEPGPAGDGADRADRMEVNYKRQFGDPYSGRNNAEVTVDWREPPVPRPESTLTGTFYECNPVHADLVVTDPSSWLWSGIAGAGARVPGVVGSEYDRVNPGVPTPAGIEVLTHSPVTCRNTPSYSDSAYYTVPSGAGVFNAGTSLWVAALGGPGLPSITTTEGSRMIQAVTLRLLQVMADGPMGRVHPTRSNLAALHAYRGDPIAAHAAGG